MIRKKNQEKKKKMYTIISGLILVFLMVFSIIALSFGNVNDDDLVYNDVKFRVKEVFDQQLFFSNIYKYSAVVQGAELQTYFSPQVVKSSVVSDISPMDLVDSSTFLISLPPLSQDDFSADVLFRNALVHDVSRFSGKSVIKGLTEPNIYFDDPVVSCSDAGQGVLVFVVSLVEERTGPKIIELDFNCYELQGEGEDYLLLSDYLILSARGILD